MGTTLDPNRGIVVTYERIRAWGHGSDGRLPSRANGADRAQAINGTWIRRSSAQQALSCP
jgi:hypothetical protein